MSSTTTIPVADQFEDNSAQSSNKGQKKAPKSILKAVKVVAVEPFEEATEDGPPAVVKEKKKKRKRDTENDETIVDATATVPSVETAPSEPLVDGATPAPPAKKPRVRHPAKPPTAANIEEGRTKALEYAQLYRKHKKHPDRHPWKFNKVKQRWLMKYVWDSNAIPDSDFKSVKKYLKSVQGGARAELIAECEKHLEEGATVETTVATSEPNTSVSRAKKLLKSLRKGEKVGSSPEVSD